MIRSIVIDPFLREVREAQIENSLEEFQRICGGGFIEFGIWINRKDVLYVNDFAHWRESFVIGEQRVFSGCGLITGGNGSGNDMDRSARAFQRTHAGIAVEPNDEHVGLGPVFLQVLHVAGVEHVETPVGEGDAQAELVAVLQFADPQIGVVGLLLLLLPCASHRLHLFRQFLSPSSVPVAGLGFAPDRGLGRFFLEIVLSQKSGHGQLRPFDFDKRGLTGSHVIVERFGLFVAGSSNVSLVGLSTAWTE